MLALAAQVGAAEQDSEVGLVRKKPGAGTCVTHVDFSEVGGAYICSARNGEGTWDSSLHSTYLKSACPNGVGNRKGPAAQKAVSRDSGH